MRHLLRNASVIVFVVALLKAPSKSTKVFRTISLSSNDFVINKLKSSKAASVGFPAYSLSLNGCSLSAVSLMLLSTNLSRVLSKKEQIPRLHLA